MFRNQLAEASKPDKANSVMAEVFLPIHKALCAATQAMDDELKAIAEESDLVRRLMTVPGVGPIVALSFAATLDDPGRFRRSKDVGAFLSLTPTHAQVVHICQPFGGSSAENKKDARANTEVLLQA